MERRTFLQQAALAAVSSGVIAAGLRSVALAGSNTGTWQECAAAVPPARSVIPVVGDGRWIWKEPPTETSGYLEPRSYSLDVGIELEGTGPATLLMSTTPAPVEYPEQRIDDVQIETHGCRAELRRIGEAAGQLVLGAESLVAGQVVRAVARFRLTLFKQHFGYTSEQFPRAQKVPADVRKQYLGDSPGIETKIAPIKTLAAELTRGLSHPWEMAAAFAAWTPKHIEPQLGSYTSVAKALETRRGDCEEMAGVFVALCRAAGIPARLVWIPNHTWAEFYLQDVEGEGRWIPAHTAAYHWFGWNGAHELVLQKGDRLAIPERRGRFRLMQDWTRYQGAKPKIRYLAALKPLPAASETDAGPGARVKNEVGDWRVTGDHELDRFVRH